MNQDRRPHVGIGVCEAFPMVIIWSLSNPPRSFDLCSMLESYDFDNLFLFLDPVINQVLPEDQF
jgi:hypothetical protein